MKNVQLYPVSGVFESRLHRSMLAAQESKQFDSIVFVGVGSVNPIFVDVNVKIQLVSPTVRFVKLCYLWTVFKILFSEKKAIVNVHNWYSLIPCILLFWRHVYLYEPHEVESGTSYGRRIRYLIILTEYIAIKFIVNYCIFVGVVAQNKYRNLYGTIQSEVIYSISDVSEGSFKSENKDQKDAYVGLLTFGRGLDELINAYSDFDRKLLIIGHGPLRNHLIDKCIDKPNISFLDSLNADDLHAVLAKCTLAFSFFSNPTESNKSASPNKFFQYLKAQLFVVCSTGGDQANLVAEYGIGKVVKNLNKQIITDILNKMPDTDELKERFEAVNARYSYDVQLEKYLKIYQRSAND